MRVKAGFILCFLLLLCGCAGRAEAVPAAETTLPAVTEMTVPEPGQEAAALMEAPPPAIPVVLQPEASGIREERCEVAVVDYSHMENGYVMVQFTGQTEKRLKVRVKGPRATYTYNLPAGQWEVFPLSDGNGSYQVAVYENISGTRYSKVMAASLQVELTDEFAPFLRPNQYVNYTSAPDTMALGSELCTGKDHVLEKVAAVYDYVIANVVYDDDKAATVKSGYLPVLDEVLAQKKGICFDYAALMTAMLRSQEVPCKLVVGYAGNIYHAWISVWSEENGWIDGAIFFDGRIWKRMDPTFAASSDGDTEIMDFIEHGNYTVKYLY